MPGESKRCKFCRANMPADAIYCAKCENFQDWRRNLTLSSTVLALLVALASVLGTAVPAIETALTPKNADFRFSVQSVSQDGFSTFISNAGIRPGTILPGAHLRILEAGGKTRTAMLRGQVLDEEIVPPGSSMLREYHLLPMNYNAATGSSVREVDDTFIKTGHEVSCEVTFLATDFLGHSKMRTIPFDCDKMPETKIPELP